MTNTNYLIIGSGVAGLTLALRLAEQFPNKNITIVTKSNADESNTKYAQGGIAIVIDKNEDSYQKHISDTLICGDGLCNEAVVKMVITEGPKRLKELIEWGAKFDKNPDGNLNLGKEGGHSENRVVHHKDQTGYEIERAILKQVYHKDNITVLDHHFAVNLITEENCCLGITALDEKTKLLQTYKSDVTILATGGIGHLYGHTTNPVIATGDGIAMAYRSGAKIKEMEFIQFHPTAFYDTSTESKFLISEAVRGFGAYLRTKRGYRFMIDYDSRQELASRDIVSQSIDLELKKSGDDYVLLDCTHLDTEAFKKHFPMIYKHCLTSGIDIAKDWIPVVPAQHYLCGGIVVDTNGKTSVTNLFACGECSQTGLHGANRLASNSLLEALVYSGRIYEYLAHPDVEIKTADYKISEKEKTDQPEIDSESLAELKTKLQYLMRQNAGIVRVDNDLQNAKEQLLSWKKEMDQIEKTHLVSVSFYELLNMITIGSLIVSQSIERHENRGGFVKLKRSSFV
ncbi:L-aspartate oxidase [Flavobacterium pectinovorum]|uniref:L-aspartate oxidase n=1 Tax=Flavobacterium pectinovorum TaxID=29533 RepID=UPI001FAD6840|nr:L-aspartate oxidase [Flavobacterium pectinovorum]MCI9843466.1 L-aspartate oxidase [Flavobacterium pectinovorum]